MRRFCPRLNCSGSTPMPTRLLRWMRSKLSAMTALTPSSIDALGRPVAAGAHAVVLAGQHDQRRCPPAWYFIEAS